MKLSTLKNKVIDLTIKVGDDPEDIVKVKYKPGALTYDMAENIQEIAAGAAPDRNLVVEMLLPLLESWDLEEDDGSVIPITEETLRSVPITLLAWILFEIRNTALPNPQMGANSADSSPLEEQQVVPLHTTRSSGRRGSLV